MDDLSIDRNLSTHRQGDEERKSEREEENKYNKTKTPPIRIGGVRLNFAYIFYTHKTGHGIILHCIK